MRSRRGQRAWVALCSGLAAALVGYATPHGAALLPDSVQYLAAANRLLEGHGLEALDAQGQWRPLTRFPPLYSLTLACAATVSGQDPRNTARVLQILLGACNVWLAVRLARRTAPGSFFASFAAALLAAAAPAALRTHTQALSEGLFLTFLLIALERLVAWSESRNTWTLHACALATAAAMLTRYAGAAVFVFAVIVVIRAGPRRSESGSTGRPLTALFAVSLIPTVAWLARNQGRAGDLVNRSFRVHPPEWQDFMHGLATIGSWLTPWEPPPTLLQPLARAMPLVALLAILLLWRHRLSRTTASVSKKDATPGTAVSSIPWAFSGVYLAFIVVARTFVDAAVPFDDRLLLPVLITLGPLCAAGTWRWASRTRPAGRLAIRAAILVWLVSLGVRSLEWSLTVRHVGQGLESPAWRDSPTLAEVHKLPDDCHLVSNAPDAILLWTGRPAALLPVRYDPITRIVNPSIDRNIEHLLDRLHNHQSAVVCFDRVTWRAYLLQSEELLARTHDRARVARTEDGWLAGCGTPASAEAVQP